MIEWVGLQSINYKIEEQVTDALTLEMYKARKLPLVAKVYCTSKLDLVVVELVINPAIVGLEKSNVFTLSTDAFCADQISTKIIKIIAEAAKL